MCPCLLVSNSPPLPTAVVVFPWCRTDVRDSVKWFTERPCLRSHVHAAVVSPYDRGVVFRVPPSAQASEGHVDYRLARASVLAEYRAGIIDRTEVCDAHPELKRAARQVGSPTPGSCPICDAKKLVHVTYVFGPRLPKHGRCISLRGELARLAKRGGTHVAYVVEVCQTCSWNHLVRRSTLSKDDAANDQDPADRAAADSD